MNKKVILIVVGLLLVLGIGGYFVMSNQAGSQTSSKETNSPASQTLPKSLKDLLSLGQSQECTFSDETGNKGTMYVASSKVRGNFTTKVEDKDVGAQMIVDGQTTYFWMDGQSTGYKMSTKAQAENISPSPGSTPDSKTGSIDVNKDMNFSCKFWSVDQSVFEVPADIKFMDLSELSSPAKVTTDVKTSQCSACDSVPESAKAQCKSSLGCN